MNKRLFEYKKIALSGSSLVIFICNPVQANNTPITVTAGQNITLQNENININTTDNTFPINQTGGILSILDSTVTLTTNANNVSAIRIQSSSSEQKSMSIIGSINNRATITTNGTNSHGLSLSGTNNTVLFNYSDIIVNNAASIGIDISGTRNNITIDNTVINSQNVGISAPSSSSANIINISNSTINSYNSGITLNTGNTRNTVNITGSKINSTTGYGINALGSNITADNFEITTAARSMYGINSNWYTTTILKNGTIKTNGDYAHGAWVVGRYNNFNNVTWAPMLLHFSGES